MPAATTPARGRPDGPTAGDVMTPGPRTCSPFSTVAEAALILRDADCGAVPVLDGGRPVGILTDRDIALALPQYADLTGRPVSDVMTKGVVTVDAGTPLAAVAETFKEARVHRVLVVDAGRLAGIIAWSDLAEHLTREEVGRVVAEVSGTTGAQEWIPGVQRRGEHPPPVAPGRNGGAPTWARPGAIWGLLRETAGSWSEDKVPRLGAALAFYSTLSIAPLY